MEGILTYWFLSMAGNAFLFLGVFGILCASLSKDSVTLRTAGTFTVLGTGLLNSPLVGYFNPVPVLLWSLLALLINWMFPKPSIGSDK